MPKHIHACKITRILESMATEAVDLELEPFQSGRPYALKSHKVLEAKSVSDAWCNALHE